jgi:hypothetical protein
MLVGCVILASFSCTRSLDRDEYVRWVSDYENGLHVSKESAPFIFDVQYQPTEYLAILDHSDLQEGNAMQRYVLKVSMVDPKDNLITHSISTLAEKQQRLYYFSFLFQNDLFLEENGEELPCVLFHFEQSGVGNYQTFLLGFEHPKKGHGTESKLVVKSEKFGSLPIKIKISKQDIPTVRV